VLAESLEVLARAPDTMAVQVPPPGGRDVGVGEPAAKDGEPWTTTEVAFFCLHRPTLDLGTSGFVAPRVNSPEIIGFGVPDAYICPHLVQPWSLAGAPIKVFHVP